MCIMLSFTSYSLYLSSSHFPIIPISTSIIIFNFLLIHIFFMFFFLKSSCVVLLLFRFFLSIISYLSRSLSFPPSSSTSLLLYTSLIIIRLRSPALHFPSPYYHLPVKHRGAIIINILIPFRLLQPFNAQLSFSFSLSPPSSPLVILLHSISSLLSAPFSPIPSPRPQSRRHQRPHRHLVMMMKDSQIFSFRRLSSLSSSPNNESSCSSFAAKGIPPSLPPSDVPHPPLWMLCLNLLLHIRLGCLSPLLGNCSLY